MEVGDERIDSAECARRINKDAGLGEKRLRERCGVAFEKIFDRAHACSAHGNTATGRRKERGLRGGGHLIHFAVDRVFLHRVGHDRFEGAEADVKRDIGGANAVCAEFVEQLRREMESGGGRGHRDLTIAIGVNGLVALEILRTPRGGILSLDVGRQRHFAEAIGERGDGFAGGNLKTHERAALGIFGEHFTAKSVAVRKRGADGQFFSRTDKTPPRVFPMRRIGTGEKTFDGAAGGTLCVEARGEHGGVVAEEDVAALQEARQIAKMMMRERVVGAIDHEQARRIAARGRRLGDEMRGKVVVEEIGGQRHGTKRK